MLLEKVTITTESDYLRVESKPRAKHKMYMIPLHQDRFIFEFHNGVKVTLITTDELETLESSAEE